MSYSLHNKRMSTGITILNASYGAGATVEDVTSQVTSHIKDGKLNLPVSLSSLNITDPAPGQPKQLTVSYTINNGSTNSKIVSDGSTLSIDAPPQTVASGLTITKAEYGYSGNYTDVTDAIQSYVSDGSISLTVSPSSAGIPDPNPNKKKNLKVVYTLNGSKNSETIDDGSKFVLSAPPLDAPGTKTPKQKLLSGAFSITSSIGYFITLFTLLLNLFACVRISLNWFNTIVPGVVIGIFPYSFFWAVLPTLFFRRCVFSMNALTDAVKNPIGGLYLQYV